MKKLFLIAFFSIGFGASIRAQYYYDRSKNPDKIPAQPNKPQNQPIKTPRNYGEYSKFFFASWDGNKPMSNTSFIDKFSGLGTRIGFRKRLNSEDKFWVGGDFSWAVYNQYVPYQTYTSGTQSVSTDMYNYSYNYGVTVNIDYFFFPMDKLFVPYLGFGVGVAYDKFNQFYNIYGNSPKASWGLLVRPEAGFLVGFKKNSGWRIKAAAHFDYASNTNSTYGYKNFINTGVQIGVVRMLW